MSERSFSRSLRRRVAARRRRDALRLRRSGLAASAVLGAGAFLAPSAGAAILFVDETGDPPTGPCSPGLCSLRDAVEVADANAEPDAITFSLGSAGPIRLNQGPIIINGPDTLVIAGPGRDLLSVSGDALGDGPDPGDSRVFEVSSPADVFITDLTVADGYAFRGGAIATYGTGSVTIGDAAITGSRAGGGGGGGVRSEGDLTITRTVISGNRAAESGGGVLAIGDLVLEDSTVSGNHAVIGGGLSLEPTAVKYTENIDVAATTISGNTAVTRGAGVRVAAAHASDAVTIRQSTISGNAGFPGSSGGGLFVGGTIRAEVEVRNSTISGNAATRGGGAAFGDGPGQIDLRGDGSVGFRNSTIASNNAFDSGTGGGLYLSADQFGGPPAYGSPIVALDSTIVGDNRADGEPEDLVDLSESGGFAAAFSLIESPGATALIEDSAETNILGRDPRLAPLEDEAGATPTHRPDSDSPVIDQGRSPSGLARDQRGKDRTVEQGVSNPPGGDGTDIGSVEVALIESLGLCRGEEATIRAAPAGSVTRGTRGPDVILGSGGSDEIRAGRGRDLVCAEGGGDSVQAGGGADTVLGSGGGDQLFGQSGEDVLNGGRGRDRLGGASGADRLFGGSGADRLGGGADRDGVFGQDGRDNMRGGKAADDLDGGPGPDRLVGGPGEDRLRGGPGNDREIE